MAGARARAANARWCSSPVKPGIGKTTLVNALLQEVSAARANMRVARGQCLEQYGAGEAYLPVLDGLSRLGRAEGGERIIQLLRRARAGMAARVAVAAAAPAEREIAPAASGGRRPASACCARWPRPSRRSPTDQPLILVLEDLHWSDYSTLDLVAYLARRRDPARLMVIGTYRPVEVILGDHPLKGVKRELQAHGLVRELPLDYLTEEAVAQYLAVRFPRHQLPKRLARLVHRRSEGNPLFMVNLAEYLIAERMIVAATASGSCARTSPASNRKFRTSIRQLIEKQIERLNPDERRVLEGASVVGMECSSVAIAAGLDEPAAWVEEHCEALVTTVSVPVAGTARRAARTAR